MILSGEKKEEYRETTRYWKKRLMQAQHAARSPEDPDNRNFLVALRNGYRADSPRAIIEVREITVGAGNPEWGAAPGVYYFILHIAKVVKWNNGQQNKN